MWLAQRLVLRRHEDALRLAASAATRDPLSPMIGAQRGWFLCLLRKYDESMAMLLENIDLDPLFFRTHFNLALCYLEMGRPDSAAEAVRRAAALTCNPILQVMLAECEARAGDRSAALAFADTRRGESGYVSACKPQDLCGRDSRSRVRLVEGSR
jgi:Tfp pilus assembly protein PilF